MTYIIVTECTLKEIQLMEFSEGSNAAIIKQLLSNGVYPFIIKMCSVLIQLEDGINILAYLIDELGSWHGTKNKTVDL